MRKGVIIFGIILLVLISSGCTSLLEPSYKIKCSTGEKVSDPSMCPEVTTATTTPSTTTPAPTTFTPTTTAQPPEVERPEEVPPEEVAVPKEEYAEFTLTFPYEEKIDFQAKTIFISEIFENVPFSYIQIGLFGESPYIAPYVQMGQLEEFLSTVSLSGLIDNIEKKEEKTREAKDFFIVIVVKKPEVIPQKVVCDLEEETYLQRDDPLCHISIIGQVTGGEPLSISFGKATFYFKENNIIEGEIDAYYPPISGKIRIKIREGTTLIEKEKLIEEAERKIKEAKEIQEEEKEISARDSRRVNDIMLISETLQRYYRDERKYFQSKTIPAGIDPYYLVPALKDPLTRDPYNWLDNTPGALTGCDDQHFCLWAELEGSGFKFKVASEKGVTQLKTQPTKCPCQP